MAEDRFDRLEKPSKLPEKVASAIARLDRFGHLEIAGTPATPPPTRSPAAINRLMCPRCAQPNEQGRDICWACFKPLQVTKTATPASDQEIELLLDGVAYRSGDPTVPADVREMMDRIRRDGYKPEVLQEWLNKRKRAAEGATPTADETTSVDRRVQVVDGRYIDIIRIDDVVYKSDDPQLPEEVRELFRYIDREGVTPALLQHLRLYGTKVRYRSANSMAPSDGDQSFWDAVRRKFKEGPDGR